MNEIDRYLDRACRAVSGPAALRRHLRKELREHLEEAIQENTRDQAVIARSHLDRAIELAQEMGYL